MPGISVVNQTTGAPAAGSGGSGTVLATVAVNNFSGTTSAAGMPVTFAHVFKDGDVPIGNVVEITDGAANVLPIVGMRRSAGLTIPVAQGYISIDFACNTARSIAGSGSETLTLTSLSGSWNDTLPAGKSVANIVTDITTNFSNYVVDLNGLNYQGTTEGSGHWRADAATGFASGTTVASTGYYRCVAHGPAAADFVLYVPFYDVTGGAKHASLWCAIYITAFLNSTTGAVTRLRGQAWVKQGKHTATSKGYRCQPSIALNNTTVRSWGATPGDGRNATFTSANVNTGANTITVAGSTFAPGQLVQFSSTGTLPAPLAAATDYYVGPTTSAGTTLSVYTDFSTANGVRGVTYTPQPADLTLTSGGSGTHTIQGFLQMGYWNAQPLMRADGNWDWWADNTGTLNGEPTLWPVQSNTYYHASGKIPPILLTALALTTDTFPAVWSPGCLSTISDGPNAGGAHQEYGMQINEFGCRRINYPADRLGYVQTHRVGALAHTQWNNYLTDASNFRFFASNNTPQRGPYAGINQIPLADLYGINSVPPTPQGSLGSAGLGNIGQSHWWTFTYALYIFEGGQPMLDFIQQQGVATMCYVAENSGYASGTRNQITSAAGTIWTPIVHSGNDSRANAWKLSQICDSWVVSPSEGPEASYPEKESLADYLEDAGAFVAYCRSSNGFGTNFAAMGGWPAEMTATGPPGVTNVPGSGAANAQDAVCDTNFFQFYISCAWFGCYMRYPSASMLVNAQHMGNYVNNWWTGACSFYSNAYNHKVMLEPGWAASAPPNASRFCPPSQIAVQPQMTDGVIFLEDGATVAMLNDTAIGAQFAIPLQNGDQVFFWDGYDTTAGPSQNSAWDLPPSGVSPYTPVGGLYYIHNVNSLPAGAFTITTFTLSTTDPTDTPVTWSPGAAVATTTLNGAINSSQTSIPLNGFVATGISPFVQVAKIDSEYLAITPSVIGLSGYDTIWMPTTSGNVLQYVPTTSPYFAPPLPSWIAVGAPMVDVYRSGVIPPGTTVTSVDRVNNTVTMSANVTSGGVQAGDVISYGFETMTAVPNTSFLSGGTPSGRGSYGTTAASHSNGATVTLYRTVNLLVRTEGRPTGCPGNMVNFGDGGTVPFGYLTGWRQAAWFGYKAGAISQTAFTYIDGIFQNWPAPTGGPTAFALQSSLMQSTG